MPSREPLSYWDWRSMKIEKRQAWLTLDDFPSKILTQETLGLVITPLSRNQKIAVIHLGAPSCCFLCGAATDPQGKTEVNTLHEPDLSKATLLVHTCPNCGP